MGADACHHPGLLRPSPYLPLPRTVQGYSGAALQGLHPRNSAQEPFFTPSEQAFPAQEQAQATIQKIIDMDAQDHVFVVLTHDASLQGEMAFFPETINSWMGKGAKERTRWLFCKELAEALS